MLISPGPDPEMLLPGGALKAEGLYRAAKAARGLGEYERGFKPPFILGIPGIFCLKIYVSENAFQAILKPIFPYSIT